MLSTFTHITSLLLSASAFCGVMIHDLRVDKVANVLLAPPSAFVETGPSTKLLAPNDAHTHVEKSAFSQAVRMYQHAAAPGIQPRSDERRHLMQRYTPKGHHAFDNYNLPLLS